MTSISSAQPRPPPLHLHPGLHRAQSQSGPQIPRIHKGELNGGQDKNDNPNHDRPAKRRKVSSGSLNVSIGAHQNQSATTQVRYQNAPWPTVLRLSRETQIERGTEIALPPLPDRPWGTTAPREALSLDTRPPVRVRKNVAVPNVPDSIETPSDAPLFEQKRADYFPWTGRHPEDVLNESHVRQGFFDRPPNPPDKELNTAKPPLYGAFKHKSGLESLSALFSLVLESKSRHGTFSSTSSFKGPPPRVTLTEAKRKSWMSDLANSEVPLRKLSKTIPQGIRGPSLLDQCLQNNIPLSRAIWFIKCVGANEIRTLKRKGVNPAVSQGAELKWLREWTISVEQFIENVLGQCGQDKWKEKIRYSVVLAARLFLENLLDRDHYLDWVLKSLSNANANHWPFWLMIVHLHRLDLVAFRKKGKQLAENLITKYNLAKAAPGEALRLLAQNFAAAIKPLIATRPNCFLMPDKWNECQKALSACLDLSTDPDRQTFEYLKFINERASGGVRPGGAITASPTEQLVEILDSFGVSTPIADLFKSLCQACADRELLMQKCLEWCVTKFRTGKTRIYLCARLFRKLRKQGYDVDKTLLDFIFLRSQANNVDNAALKHLVSELSRSSSFPLSRYMQSLSVRGMPRANSVRSWSLSINLAKGPAQLPVQDCEDGQQLLTEICMLHVEDHLANLRGSLLTYAGFSEDTETATYDRLCQNLSSALAQNDRVYDQRGHTLIQYGRLPWTIRTRLCYWLRSEAATLARASQTETPGKPPLPGVKSLTLSRFHMVRDVLEQAEDIAILADVLRITASSRQEDVLGAAVDTINMHSSTLSAIGAFEPLQLIYCQTYVALRSVKTAMPLFATSLISLCQQHPSKVAPLRALLQDLIRGDRGRAVTACSPFSDGVAESLQQAGATFYDDFEAILQTESNMNDQTMMRLFKVLVERIEKTQHDQGGAHDLYSLCQLLARLKLCQKSQGEILIKKWVTRLFTMPSKLFSSQLLYCLICTRCVQLEVVVEACQQVPTGSTSRLFLYNCVRRAITDTPEEGADQAHFYGFKLAVSKLSLNKPVEVLDIVGTDESGRASATPTKPKLIAAVLSNPEMIKALSKPAWFIVSQTLSEYLSDINATDPPEVQARALALSAGPLSLQFCSLRMRMLCQNASTKNDENIQDNIASTLCATIADSTSSLPSSPRTFQTLLRATGPILSAKVRTSIEQLFFTALPKFLQSKSMTQPPFPTQDDFERTALALQQVVLVSNDMSVSSSLSGIGTLIEKLTIYMKTLGPSNGTTQQPAVSSPTATSVPAVAPDAQSNAFLIASLDHLNFLLQMLCLKRSVFSSTASQPLSTGTRPLQQDQIKLVGLLITIGTHPAWSSILTTTTDRTQQGKVQAAIDHTFDVAATLVDDMSDESRTFCARILKDKVKDGRVRWLLGSVNSFGSVQSHDAGQGYQVVHESKGVLGDWKPKTWEMLESGAPGDSCLGLGLFGARKI